MYALQEEPERKNRLWILLVGLILGLGLQGGGLWAAHTYQPPEKKRKQVLIEMTVIEKKKPPNDFYAEKKTRRPPHHTDKKKKRNKRACRGKVKQTNY
mgnify:CR=1 FL=1